jgi:hypothetical protein
MKKVTLQNYRKDKYYLKIVKVVDKILIHEREIKPVDVFLKMGMIEKKDIDLWKKGKIPYLEMVLHGSLPKLNRILRILRFHAHDLNLIPRVTPYQKNKKVLRFSKSGNSRLEESYSRHFIKQCKSSTV